MSSRIPVSFLKIMAATHEYSLLYSVGVTDKHLNGKHQPCPCCGGKDRFRWDKKKERYICNSEGKGYQDWLSLIAHISFGGSISSAIDYCCDKLGLQKMTDVRKAELIELGKRRDLENKQRLERERLRQIAVNDRVALEAQSLWSKASPVTQHPYLTRKQIPAFYVREYQRALLIPGFNAKREIRNIQRIYHDGSKFFLKDGNTNGLFHVVGRITGTEKVLIAEGYATAVSLHLHYQKPVIVAFTAGNLANVISSIRSIYPLLPLVICADNDMHKVSGNKVNVGVSYARESVRRFKGIELLIPAFSYELCQEKTDFNDLCVFGSGKFKHIKVENEYVVTRESFIQHVNYNFTEDLRIIQ